MLLQVSNSAARWSFVFLGVMCTGFFLFFGIRNARAAHQADLNTKGGYEEATRLEPQNAQYWYLLGHYWQHSLEEADPSRAIRFYRTSLALNPRSADTWMDLGTVYELEANTRAARDAFLQAKQDYPLSFEVSWRYGNFLLRQNEIPQAFAEIRHALSVEPRRSAEAVSRCWRVDPDIHSLLDNVLPADRDAYLEVIQLLGAEEHFAAAMEVWARLISLHPRFQLAEAIPFTYTLVEKHQIDDARHVWEDAIRLSGTPAPPDPPDSVLWDGGFETGIQGGGFAWYFSPASEGVRTALDSREKHSGQRSLRVSFDGRHNVGFQGVCNNAEVQAGVPYLLSAWIRAQALTTDQGIRLRLIWTENSRGAAVETSDVLGTQPWTQLQMSWTPPKDVHQVRVCVARGQSTKLDNQIQGAAWLDDVALVPQSLAKAKP